jgi:DNA repair protein RecO (recombination protein O)
MSEIVKTEAFVLSKIDYSDSSNITSLFSREYGKISVIAKGSRNPKSKIGLVIDPPNYIGVVFYKKDSRELQIISSADIIEHYPSIRSDLEKLKYSFAILELVKNLTAENEEHMKLFSGLKRIFYLLNSSNQPTKLLFGRFFIFFLSEIGYEIQIERCVGCGKSSLDDQLLSYSFENGILCAGCKSKYVESYIIDTELFKLLKCLKFNKTVQNFNDILVDNAISFMEKFLKYHVPDFKGIQSLRFYN